uniref:Uncharacterized protein n=1 Tax=Rhizophora mucronata TaxID=61149 RepID=A0A2P2M059_RHIMU
MSSLSAIEEGLVRASCCFPWAEPYRMCLRAMTGFYFI